MAENQLPTLAQPEQIIAELRDIRDRLDISGWLVESAHIDLAIHSLAASHNISPGPDAFSDQYLQIETENSAANPSDQENAE